MTRSFKASPLGKSSGLAIGRAGGQTFVAVVLPKIWRPNDPKQHRVRWPERDAEAQDYRIVALYEGDTCTIELAGNGEENQENSEAIDRRKEAIDACINAARKSANKKNGGRGSPYGDGDDQELAAILEWTPEITGDQNGNGQGDLGDGKDPIELIFDLLERAESAKVMDMDSQLASTELTSVLLRPLLYRRFLGEIGDNLHDIRRGYVRLVDIPRAIRGQITQRGLITYAATGAPELECSYDQFTEETPLFRVLVTALRMVASTGRPRAPFNEVRAFKALAGEAAGLAHYLASIRPLPRSEAAALAGRLRLPRTLHRWEKALDLARLVLRERERKPRLGGAEQTDAIAITLPTDKLWEAILAQALEKLKNSSESKVGEFRAQAPVPSPWRPPGDKEFGPTKNADFLVLTGADPTILWCLDAKYKQPFHKPSEKFTPSSGDQYQMFAYSHLAGWPPPPKKSETRVSNCALVYPVAKEDDSDGGGDGYKRAPDNDVTLYILKLPFPTPVDVETAQAWSDKIGHISNALEVYLNAPAVKRARGAIYAVSR